jgi:hypothetical protein
VAEKRHKHPVFKLIQWPATRPKILSRVLQQPQ